MKRWLPGICCSMICWSALAADGGHEHHMPESGGTPLPVSLVFDATGTLWRARSAEDHVIVDHSADAGKTFSTPLVLNAEPQKIATMGDSRPKLAIGPEGNLYATWTQMLPTPYTGHVWFSRSIDHGKTFQPAYIVHRDRAEITHALDAIAVVPSGRVYVAWIDKRDMLAAQVAKQAYRGAALYYAVSDDAGATFSPEQKLIDNTCECCRLALAAADNGDGILMWRQVYEGGIRDHAIARFSPGQTLTEDTIKRASFSNWKIDACPHHGPVIAQGGEWGWHMAWFDGSNHNKAGQPGLYYARMDGEAWVSSPAMRFGNGAQQASHPALLSQGEFVWLAWRELSPEGSAIWLKQSSDGGRNWSEARLMASTNGTADYPQLLLRQSKPYLGWNTGKDGLVMRELDAHE